MIAASTLSTTLNENVVELKFHRRRPKLNLTPWRRMLCTLDFNLLNSEKGINMLHFKSPSSTSVYSPQQKGLIAVWDILVQDWRMVNTESCHIISTISTNPPETFWDYFNVSIASMSSAQKAAFISV